MIARIWTTGIDRTRVDEYRRFARDRSLPMFRQQPGLLGVLFTDSETHAAVVSLWTDRAVVETLEESASYRATVEAILSEGFLTGTQRVEILDVTGGHLAADISNALEAL